MGIKNEVLKNLLDIRQIILLDYQNNYVEYLRMYYMYFFSFFNKIRKIWKNYKFFYIIVLENINIKSSVRRFRTWIKNYFNKKYRHIFLKRIKIKEENVHSNC